MHTLTIKPVDMVTLGRVRVPAHSIATVYIRLIYELIRFETEYKNK